MLYFLSSMFSSSWNLCSAYSAFHVLFSVEHFGVSSTREHFKDQSRIWGKIDLGFWTPLSCISFLSGFLPASVQPLQKHRLHPLISQVNQHYFCLRLSCSSLWVLGVLSGENPSTGGSLPTVFTSLKGWIPPISAFFYSRFSHFKDLYFIFCSEFIVVIFYMIILTHDIVPSAKPEIGAKFYSSPNLQC